MPPSPLASPPAAVRDLHMVLSRATTVMRASPSVLQLTGHPLQSFLGVALHGLVHDDDAAVFLAELEQATHSAAYVFRFFARLRTAHPSPAYAAFDFHGHFQRAVPIAFFVCVARPAFLSSSMHMDTLLDLKTTELRLLREIADLRAERDNESPARPPADPVRFLVTSPSLQYSEGGCTTVCGDLGIPYKLKPFESTKPGPEPPGHFICTWCATTEAPEWRRGPDGPKTLCNACGLKYSKSCRKSASSRAIVPSREGRKRTDGHMTNANSPPSLRFPSVD
ncbi:white collar 2 type of transcription factor [Diplodia intermedia]|uniref:White collar 2 type of transcription factor n=1 Tax=Diplodia intermedia TaxID=856260 RepID=A0ABR3TPU3_9PEZI